ncbi:unnamed protein product [Fusarium graminearum]|nr:unnamed protein product [Fusarium graminearum]
MKAYLRSNIIVLLLVYLNTVAARRGGGSWGGSGGGSSGGGSSGGGGSEGGSGGGTAENPPPGFNSWSYNNNGIFDENDTGWKCDPNTCGCQQLTEREIVYGIPGLYYNGTLTVQHHITNSSSWLDKGPGACGMADDEPNTYKYPALFLVAPTGNKTDTNPFHWRLFGFQPADQTLGATESYIDIYQRWVHLRSSDFVVSGTPYGGTYFYDTSIGRYTLSDATNRHRNTTAFWSTKITNSDIESLSARAVYKTKPPSLDFDPDTSRPEPASSQYITFSDVCAWNSDIASQEYKPLQRSNSSHNDHINTTTPTVWLEPGAAAEMKGIGASKMTFTLQSSLDAAKPWMNLRQAYCGDGAKQGTQDYSIDDPFELGYFYYLTNDDELSDWRLNMSFSLSFEGSLVRENSTRINGTNKDGLVFEATYETPPPDYTLPSESDGSGGSNSESGATKLLLRSSSTFVTIMSSSAVLLLLVFGLV